MPYSRKFLPWRTAPADRQVPPQAQGPGRDRPHILVIMWHLLGLRGRLAWTPSVNVRYLQHGKLTMWRLSRPNWGSSPSLHDDLGRVHRVKAKEIGS
jgi:hypothetical protein